MSSIKCPQCGLVNWATDETCKRCSTPIGLADNFQMPYPGSSYPSAQAGGYVPHTQAYQTYHPVQPADQKIGMAVASMVLALIGCGTSPIALILGIVAYKRAKRNPMEYGGKGFAVAGIVISSVMMFFFVPITAAIAIPNLLASRRAANEGSAIANLRKIAAAEEQYVVQQRSSECGDLSQLKAANYIDPVVASGEKSGYKFSIENNLDGGCEMHAVPISNSTGTRSFYISSEEGVIRAANKIGLKAGPDDPILNN